MKITEALKNITENVVAKAEDSSQIVLTPSYVAIIVVIAVVFGILLGVIIYKVYSTWHSHRGTQRRHSSRRWLVEDNPEIWTEGSFDMTKEDHQKSMIKVHPKPDRAHVHRPSLTA